TRQIDAAPAEGQEVRPTSRIRSNAEGVSQRAEELAGEATSDREAVEAFFRYIRDEEREPENDALGRSRLLVALCRNHGVPAGLVSGLILAGDGEQPLHYWAEAWVEEQWQPMCPTHDHFGARNFPEDYLVLQLGEGDLVRGHGARFRYDYLVQQLNPSPGRDGNQPPSAATMFWRKMSLYALRPVEQHLVEFMLLLPVAALIVSLFRIVIGVPTFGTFSPALLGLAFLALRALPWGLGLFVLTVLFGWTMRRLLDRFHLLQVARVSVLLTLIVLFLIVGVVVASRFGLM